MPMPSQIASVLQTYFNERNAAGLLKLWVDDFQFEGPNTAFAGRDRMLKQDENLWLAFPDMRCDIQTFITDNERAALQSRMFGTHTGPLRMGDRTVAPTGRKIDFTLSIYLRFRGEQIAGERVFYDTADFLRQLGLLS